ncbi:MAG: hypothetical protein KZQ83_12690 [gamma proteobacterium symbiont of Taylorina sp.]|nr:hypothetical protein [gamma proteobacterium symbiont of Taylorina sp.]
MKIIFYVLCVFTLVNIVFADEKSTRESHFPQQMTAQKLLTTCSSSYMTSTGRQRQTYCSGFISGVEESTRLQVKAAIAPKICLPNGKTSSQYRDIYMQYASRKTTELSKPAALVVIEALRDAFPCRLND